jgi:hypothetical protein
MVATMAECHICKGELEPVFTDGLHQFENALEIIFGGGYGMFIDTMGDDPRVMICHDCAHTLCDSVPWIAQLLDPDNSHTHKGD